MVLYWCVFVSLGCHFRVLGDLDDPTCDLVFLGSTGCVKHGCSVWLCVGS